MWRSSIRGNLIFFCVSIVLVSMVCQIIFNLFCARNLAIYQKQGQIQALYTTIYDNYTDDPQEIYDLISTAESQENIRVHIVSPDSVVYSSAPMSQDMPPRDMNDSLPADMPEDMPEDISDSFPRLQNIIPVVETDSSTVKLEESFLYQGESRTVIIWSSVVAIDSSVNLFTLSNVIVSCIVLCFSILGVYIFSRHITTPLIEIESVARNMANQNFDQKANESVRPAELHSLAVSINTMSERLETLIGELSKDNASLSSKVEYQEKMEVMRRQFVANISHEMKTPLSMLMMYSESLRADIPNIDKNYYYDTIIEEAAGLNTMVEQLLNISSIENGLLQLDCEPLDFSIFVGDLVEKMKPLLEPYVLQQDITPDLIITGDRKYLDQALRNYLSNSMSHTQQGKGITVSLKQEGDWAFCTVHNEGIPIAEEDLPHLWDSFYRGDKSRAASSQKRVGLGLYIVKTCIQAQGGEVHVENTPSGVAFSFRLPLTQNAIIG